MREREQRERERGEKSKGGEGRERKCTWKSTVGGGGGGERHREGQTEMFTLNGRKGCRERQTNKQEKRGRQTDSKQISFHAKSTRLVVDRQTRKER